MDAKHDELNEWAVFGPLLEEKIVYEDQQDGIPLQAQTETSRAIKET